MRASLAYVKPPKGFSTWSQRATDRILALSLDESVKAKVEDIEDDVLFLILYNKNDIYINGTLLDEHLAQSTSIDSNCPELIGLSKKSSSASNMGTQKLPPTTSVSSAKVCLSVPSTNQASQNLDKKPSVSINFSKPFEVASTSGMGHVTCPKSQTSQNELLLHQSSSVAKDLTSNLSSSSSSCNSEIFDDDDDAFFEEFYQKISLATKRYVKRVRTSDGYVFHILMYESKPYVSCGDISNLIWSNKDLEFMLQQLQKSGCHLANVMVWENENLNMFEQLKRFKVKGLKVLNNRTCLLVFHLNNLINILNMVGHPSVELRAKIIHEYSSFDPDHPTWKELSEVEFSDVEEEFFDRTDDDKLNRLCLYDLHVMKENIRIRHQKLQPTKSWSPASVSDEQHKLYVLHQKVVQRMKEIQQICSNFSNA